MSVVGTPARQQLEAAWAECLRDARSSDERVRYLAVVYAGRLLVAALRGRGCPRRGLFGSVKWAIEQGLLPDDRGIRQACWARDEILDGDGGGSDRCAEAVERLRTVQASIGSTLHAAPSQPQKPRSRPTPPLHPPQRLYTPMPARQMSQEPQLLQLEATSDLRPASVEESVHVPLSVRALGHGRQLVPNVQVTFDIRQKPVTDRHSLPHLDNNERASLTKRTDENGSVTVEFQGYAPGDYTVVAWSGTAQPVEFRITVRPRTPPSPGGAPPRRVIVINR